MTVAIALTDKQVQYAKRKARERQEESEKKGLKNQNGCEATGPKALRQNEIGALGEVALAVYLGIRGPLTVNTFKAPDLPGDLQVRTRSRHSYDLLVRPHDADHHYFVHATTEVDHIVILRGWLDGREAKQAQWLKSYGDRKKAYFVPEKFTHRIDELRREPSRVRPMLPESEIRW